HAMSNTAYLISRIRRSKLSNPESEQTLSRRQLLAACGIYFDFDRNERTNRHLHRHKSQFGMSHELRTPLNVIIELTDMLVTKGARLGTNRYVRATPTHDVATWLR